MVYYTYEQVAGFGKMYFNKTLTKESKHSKTTLKQAEGRNIMTPNVSIWVQSRDSCFCHFNMTPVLLL